MVRAGRAAARRALRGALAGALLLAGAGPLAAADPAKGGELARALCSRCHAVEATGASPLPIAPPFRTLHEQYPIESLAEALAEGLMTGHPGMPEIQLEPGAIADFLAYLESLNPRPRRGGGS